MKRNNTINKRLIIFVFFAAILFFNIANNTFAQCGDLTDCDTYTIQAGEWHDTNTWSGGVVPTDGVICICEDVTVTADLVFDNGNGNNNVQLKIGTGGNLTFLADGTTGTHTDITIEGKVTIEGDLNLKNGTDLIVASSGTLVVNGSINESGGNSSILPSDPVDCGTAGTIQINDGGSIDENLDVSNCFEQTMSILWTGSISTDWNNIDNWTSWFLPSSNNDVTIPNGVTNYPLVSLANADCKDLTIDDGANVVVNGQTLNVAGSLTLAATAELTGTTTSTIDITGDVSVTASGDNSGQLAANGTLSVGGTLTYNRNLPSTNWHYISSPTSNGVAGSLYDETVVDNWSDLLKEEAYTGWVNGTSSPGVGVAINAAASYTFSGNLNPDGITYNATYSTTTAGDTYDGWHLVGNPYPCAINWSNVTKVDVEATAYTLNEGEYEAFLASLPPTEPASLGMPSIYTGRSGNLPAAQGFFIKALSGGGSITFNFDDQISDNVALYKRNANFEDYVYNALKVKISANGYDNIAALRLYNNATEAFDPQMDARKRYSNIARKPELFAITPENTELIISTLPETNNQMSSKLGYQIGVNSTCTIELTEFVEGTVVILKDNLLGTETNLADEKYTFTTNKGKFTNRFEISVAPPLIWRGKVSDNWNTAENWDKNIVPTANNNVIIPAGKMPKIDGHAVCKNIHLKAGAHLTINGSLTVSEEISLGAEKERVASVKNNGTLQAENYIIEKYVQAGKYTYLASPVDGEIENTTSDDVFNAYVEVDSQWSSDNISVAQSAKGWKYIPSEEKTIRFKGINTIDNEGYAISAQSTDLQTKGLNLIGNPYLTAIDIDKFIETNSTAIDGTVYLYEKQSDGNLQFDDYTYANSLGIVGFGNNSTKKKYLHTGEAMFVKALSDSKVFFETNMQVAENELYPSISAEKPISIRFSLQSPSAQYNETLLAFTTAATDNYDNGMDAAKIENDNSIALYTLNKNSLKLAIQAVNENEVAQTAILLGYQAVERGEHQLQLTGQNKMDKLKFYLRDNETGKLINIAFDGKYTFTTEAGTFDNRFELVFTQMNTWNGSVSDNWHESENWEFGVPTIEHTVLIPSGSKVALNSTATCYAIEISGTATLNIKQDGALSVTQKIYMKENESGTPSLVDNNKVTTEGVIFEKQLPKWNTKLLSNPTSGENSLHLDNVSIYKHNESEDIFRYTGKKITLNSTQAGMFFNLNEDAKIIFSGNIPADKYDVSVTKSPDENFITTGLNLIGNPFTAKLNIKKVMEANMQTDVLAGQVMQMVNKQTEGFYFHDYTYHTLVGEVGTENYANNEIGVGEAFFVKAKKNGNITLTKDMVNAENAKRSDENVQLLKMSIKDNSSYNETLLAFTENATEEYDDYYDAEKVDNWYHNLFLYSLANAEKRAINAVSPINYEETRTYPIGFSTQQAGEHTIVLNAKENFGSDVKIYLNDKKTNQTIDFDKTTSYTFNVEAEGEYNSRFEIFIKSNAPEYCTWTGAVSDVWENPDNWTPNMPGSNSEVVIPQTDNMPVVNSIAVCKNLSISPNANITINKNYQLNIGGNLKLNADANGHAMLLDKGTLNVSGTSIVEVYVEKNTKKLMGAPVKQAYTNVFENSRIEQFSDNQTLRETTVSSPMQQTAFAVTNTNAVSNTYTFSGELNTGMVFIPVSDDNNGWNLISNPFTTYLDWNADAGWSRNIIGTTFYYLKNNNIAGYNRTLNLSFNANRSYIEPFEGFFVKSYTVGNISVNSNAKTLLPTENTTSSYPMLRISVSDGQIDDETIVLKMEEASQSTDIDYDSEKLLNFDETVPQIFSRSLNNSKFAINAIPNVDESTKTLLGVRALNGQNLSILFDENTLGNHYLFLEDLIEDKMIDLSVNSQYDFTATTNDAERFVIHYNQQELVSEIEGKNQSNINIYAHRNIVYINQPDNNVLSKVEIYTIKGTLIFSNKLNLMNRNEIRLQNVATGAYIVKVINPKEVKIQKVFID